MRASSVVVEVWSGWWQVWTVSGPGRERRRRDTPCVDIHESHRCVASLDPKLAHFEDRILREALLDVGLHCCDVGNVGPRSGVALQHHAGRRGHVLRAEPMLVNEPCFRHRGSMRG